MKKLFFISIVAIPLMLSACKGSNTNNDSGSGAGVAQSFNLDTTRLKPGTFFYECEMHPEVLSDKMGSCPKCGMDLTQRAKKN